MSDRDGTDLELEVFLSGKRDMICPKQMCISVAEDRCLGYPS